MALSSRRNLALACVLSGVAGYVDGIGFIHLGGLFVSFMSGNSTRLGVSAAEGDWVHVIEATGLIALFVFGAGSGSLIARGRSVYRQSWILFVEGLLLLAAAVLNVAGLQQAAIAVVVVAMGLENAVFQVDGGAGLGLTYMTGALVKVGQLAAAALTGGARWGWVPNLLLWAALVVGALFGGLAYHRFGLASIWFAAGAVLMLSVILMARAWRGKAAA